MNQASCDPAARARALGRAIRQARSELTQEELRLRLGVPQTTVSRWELGRCGLTVEQIRSLEQALGLRAGALLIAGGYVAGDELPTPTLRTFMSDDLAAVIGTMRTAQDLGLGVRVTNRWEPTGAPDEGVVRWTVVTSGELPGDDT